MALIAQRTDKVDYWRNSNQKQRWLATALLDIEPRLNRIKEYRYLPELRTAIQRELGIRANEVVAAYIMETRGRLGISTNNGIDSSEEALKQIQRQQS